MFQSNFYLIKSDLYEFYEFAIKIRKFNSEQLINQTPESIKKYKDQCKNSNKYLKEIRTVHRMKGQKESKSSSVNYNPNQRSIDNVTQILDELFQMRLVERVSMPIERDKKLTIATKFRQKMNYLHSLLTQIQKQGWKDVQTVSTKDKTKSRSGMSKIQQMQKDQIKKVQMMYNQLFVEGSFKYYKKVATVFNLPTDMEPIDITVWARNYKNQENYETDCCCHQGSCCD